ncbi:MAG: hypothetical protein IPJ71_11180 [Bdellovibrionales bacterium]|nr:hypothetical protein [Bdellovibrionales bacterium]
MSTAAELLVDLVQPRTDQQLCEGLRPAAVLTHLGLCWPEVFEMVVDSEEFHQSFDTNLLNLMFGESHFCIPASLRGRLILSRLNYGCCLQMIERFQVNKGSKSMRMIQYFKQESIVWGSLFGVLLLIASLKFQSSCSKEPASDLQSIAPQTYLKLKNRKLVKATKAKFSKRKWKF